MTSRIVFKIIAVVVLLVAVAGIAAYAYNLGIAQGAAYATAQAAIQGGEAPGLPPSAAPYFYGRHYTPFGMPYGPPFGGFFLACLIPALLFFLFIGGIRWLFWGRMYGMRHHHGPWNSGGPWGEGVPPRVEEWHRKMHETPAPGGEPSA
jgi:hypothetical protein